ncbi:MAG TPA: hypothetical protein VM933_06485 [Acidimicrobiales bacterium]|nr:hypothetical protein [Acidimicrobiales bacterium]
MTELSTALQSFVDQPVAPPPSIASLMDRNRARRRRRGLGLAGSSIAAVIVAGVSIGSFRAEPSPVAIDVTGPSSRSAAYLATVPGGYEASGLWQLTVIRGEDRFVYSNETSPSCGDVGTIRVGDRVYAAIESAESLVRAGEDAHC